MTGRQDRISARHTDCPPSQSARRLRFHRLIVWVCVLFSACSCFGGDARKKIDIVYMRNGDKITCEVKSLSQGQLFINPDYTASSFAVDWSKVARIESSQQFIISDPKGDLYVGSLTGSAQKHTVTIVSPHEITLPQNSVIQIAELGASFARRLSGDISVGLSLSQSNAQSTLATQINLKYQDQKHVFTLAENSQFATQQKTSNTNETTLKTSFFRQLKKTNWYGGAIANFLSSSEQQINLQSTLAGALERRLIFTNKTNLSAIAGLGYTVTSNASGSTSTGKTNSFDSALSVQYSPFRFNSTTFDTTVWVYP